MFKLVRMST